jgi:hypothetical protein
MNTLPEEIENYILWLAVGAMDLDIYNKKKAINKEFKFFKELRKKSKLLTSLTVMGATYSIFVTVSYIFKI